MFAIASHQLPDLLRLVHVLVPFRRLCYAPRVFSMKFRLLLT